MEKKKKPKFKALRYLKKWTKEEIHARLFLWKRCQCKGKTYYAGE